MEITDNDQEFLKDFDRLHPELELIMGRTGLVVITSGEYRKHHCRSCCRWAENKEDCEVVEKVDKNNRTWCIVKYPEGGNIYRRGCVRYERARKNDPACNEWVPRTIEEKEIKENDNVDLP